MRAAPRFGPRRPGVVLFGDDHVITQKIGNIGDCGGAQEKMGSEKSGAVSW